VSEFLTVRLSSQANEPIQWLVWSASQQEVIASGELQDAEQLSQLSDYAKQRPTILLLPSSHVLLKQIEVPAGASRQLGAMLPFLVEDDVAQDVDELHFSVLDKSAGQASIVALNKAYLSDWLAKFKLHGLMVKQVLPDCLALPLLDNQISALQLGEQWLFRTQAYQGFSLEADWLAVLDDHSWASALPQPVASHDSDEDEPVTSQVTITAFTPLPAEHEQLSGNWQLGEPELVMAMLTKGALDSKANLLTGEFKPTSSWLKHWKVWQKAAVAAVFLLVVMVAQNWLQVQSYEAQAAQYRAESERIFKQIFPNKRKIPTISYLKRQMNDEASRLSGQGSHDSLLVWLAQLPQSLAKVKSMDVVSVKYDGARGEIRIQAKADDFQSFEAVRSELSEQFEVEQGQLNRNGKEVFGSYVIRRKP